MEKIKLLIVLFLINTSIQAQEISYGDNPEAGSYFDAGGVKLYYETYGNGEPVLLLHGGVYGYIDGFKQLISKLAENYKVICLATRGHGKSEIGHEPLTYEQRAGDAYKLIRHLKIDSVIILGSSDGGHTAFKVAAIYREVVKKVIAMGVGEIPKSRIGMFNYSAEGLLAENKELFEKRLKLMPEPERWNECLQMHNDLYNNVFISVETYSKIQCPVLIINGENDVFFSIDATIQCCKNIPNASMAIIPGCGHSVYRCDFPAVWLKITEFLNNDY